MFFVYFALIKIAAAKQNISHNQKEFLHFFKSLFFTFFLRRNMFLYICQILTKIE